MNESEIARRIEQVFRDEEQKRKSNRWDVIDFFAAFLLAELCLTNPEEGASSTASRLKLRETPMALLSRF